MIAAMRAGQTASSTARPATRRRARVAACLALAAVIAGSAGFPSPAAPGPKPDSAERRLLDLVNSERSRRGVRRLAWDEDLARLARKHAEDMRRTGEASHHSSSDGADFQARLVRSGYRARAAAENVALDRNVERAHAGLMDSPGHRKNILDAGLTAIGIGLARDVAEDSLYVVEDFATPIPVLTDREAAQRVRLALGAARRQGGGSFLEEDAKLSAALNDALRKLIERDSVKVASGLLPGPGWVVAYTSAEPSDLPEEARRSLKKTRSGRYGVTAAYARTKSQPLGSYWILLGVMDEQ